MGWISNLTVAADAIRQTVKRDDNDRNSITNMLPYEKLSPIPATPELIRRRRCESLIARYGIKRKKDRAEFIV
jgi:hypothetical protein